MVVVSAFFAFFLKWLTVYTAWQFLPAAMPPSARETSAQVYCRQDLADLAAETCVGFNAFSKYPHLERGGCGQSNRQGLLNGVPTRMSSSTASSRDRDKDR